MKNSPLSRHLFNFMQVCRFLRLLCSSGVNLKDVVDFLHNTPLHIAATKNFISLAKFLIDSYPYMLMAINGQSELPVETAIRHSQDDVAAFLIRRMDHRRLASFCCCFVQNGRQLHKRFFEFEKNKGKGWSMMEKIHL